MGGSDAAGLRRGQIDALETGAPAAEQLQVRQGIEQRRVADLRAEGDNGCHAAGLFGRQCRGWMLVERPEDFETCGQTLAEGWWQIDHQQQDIGRHSETSDLGGRDRKSTRLNSSK